MKKIAINFALLFGSLLFCLVLLEIGVRLFGPAYTIGKPDPDFGYRAERNAKGFHSFFEDGKWQKVAFSYNSEGFRDVEHKFEKPADVCRVLVVGDSFVVGRQVKQEEIVHNCIARGLKKALGDKPKTEVINASAVGYSTGIEYLLLESFGLKYDPDVVVLFYFQNDPYDNSPEFNSATTPYFVIGKNGELEKIQPGSARHKKRKSWISKTLNRYSRFYVWQKQKLSIIEERVKVYFRKREGRFPKMFNVLLKPSSPAVERAWKVTEELFVMTASLLAKKNIPLIVVNIPHSEMVSKRAKKALYEKYPGMKKHEFDWGRSERCFRKVLERAKFEYIPLEEEMLKATTEENDGCFYFPNDLHWTAAGHKIASDVVVLQLVRILKPQN